MHLYRANDYDQYSYGSIDSSVVTADIIALKIMELDHTIFGARKYQILDTLLFASHPKLNSIKRTIRLKPNTMQMGKFSFYVVCLETPNCFCIRFPGSCNETHTCMNGTCDLCYQCINVTCTTVAIGGGTPGNGSPWPPDPPPPPGGGGSNPPAGGGNCSGVNNCAVLRSLIVQGRVPCGGCGSGPLVVVPPDEPPVNYVNTDSLLAQISRSIKSKADSIFNLSTQQNYNEWGMIIVRKNGNVYAKNEKTDNDPNYVKLNWFLQSGEELIGDSHVHNDTDSLGRSSFSGDDLTALRRNKNKYQYVKFIDCGNVSYAFVIEDVLKAGAFFSQNQENIIIDSISARAYRHPLRYSNWQHATSETMMNYLGSSSVSGIGMYKSNNSDKTSFIKLN